MVFIKARSVDTGKVQQIPERWLDHEEFGPKFEKVGKSVPVPPGQPSTDWKLNELQAYADSKRVSLVGVKRSKPAMLKAIEAGMSHNIQDGTEPPTTTEVGA